MSADLDRLLARTEITPYGDVYVSIPTIRRIHADYAQVVADRDRWRAIADRLGETLRDIADAGYLKISGSGEWAEVDLALDEWRAAKEEA